MRGKEKWDKNRSDLGDIAIFVLISLYFTTLKVLILIGEPIYHMMLSILHVHERTSLKQSN